MGDWASLEESLFVPLETFPNVKVSNGFAVLVPAAATAANDEKPVKGFPEEAPVLVEACA